MHLDHELLRAPTSKGTDNCMPPGRKLLRLVTMTRGHRVTRDPTLSILPFRKRPFILSIIFLC